MKINDINNLFFCAGYDKESTNKVEHNIDEQNLKRLKAFSMLASVIFILFFVLSFFIDLFSKQRFLYLAVGSLCLIVFGLTFLAKNKRWLSVLLLAIYIAIIHVFGALDGTIFGPDDSASLYVAFLLALPIVFILRPFYLFLMTINADVLFIILAVYYKSESTRNTDIVNAIVVSVISIFVGYIVCRSAISQFLLKNKVDTENAETQEKNKQLEMHCNVDLLTGLDNFFSYKSLCNSFAEGSLEKPVGVIFADLNRLKYINDTSGHEAGDEYIKGFSDDILRYFKDGKCFRISGDEFVVVYSLADEKYFNAKAKEFISFIKLEKSPRAAVGYSYGVTNDIETVKTIAEEKMYEDKNEFYKAYPEFKRSIAEKNFKNEMQSLIQVLTNSYEIMMLIDLKDDTYRVLKKSINAEAYEKERGVYSIINKKFSEGYVSTKYKRLRESFGSLDNIKTKLEHENYISYDFKLKNGQWRTGTFWRLEVTDGKVTKAIYYSQNPDESRVERLSHNQDFKIISGLTEEYSLIASIDIDDDSIEFRDIKDSYSNNQVLNIKTYGEFVNLFVARVKEDEKKDFISSLRLSNIISRLEKEKMTYFFFHLVSHTGEELSFRFNFCYEYDNSNIVFAVKDITNIVTWSKK